MKKQEKIFCKDCKKYHTKYKTRKKLTDNEIRFMTCLIYHDPKNNGCEVLEHEMNIANDLIKKKILIKVENDQNIYEVVRL